MGTTVIGFGLCGIKDVVELLRTSTPQEIEKAIVESSNNIIMIDEELREKVPSLKTEKVIITIPDRYGEPNNNFLAELTKETVGVVKQWEN